MYKIGAFLNLNSGEFRINEDIENMNYKYKLELDTRTIKKLTKIMRPALKIKGYLM